MTDVEIKIYELHNAKENTTRTVTLRPAGMKETDALGMAAVHLGSFNDCYIVNPEDPRAMKEVTDNYKNKTIGGYEEFWSEQIEHAKNPDNRHLVLVAESTRWMNGKHRDVIEGVINHFPVEEKTWKIIEPLLPEDKRNPYEWFDWDLIHIRDQYRRSGIGKAFAENVIDFTLHHGGKHLILKAFNGNASPKWFQRLGYRHLTDARIHYCDTDPVWNICTQEDLDKKSFESQPLIEIIKVNESTAKTELAIINAKRTKQLTM